MERTIYRFGRFSLDAGGDVLLRDGEPVSLTPKAIRILAVLVERRGRLVTKEELMKEVWPDTFVEEANVTQHVSVLRKVLADVGEDGRSIIETFPKRGYRFVGEVERVSETEADAAPAASAVPAALVRTRWRSTRVPLIGAAVILLLAAVAAATYYIRSTEPIPPAQLAVLPLQIVSSPQAEAAHLGVGIADAIVTRLANIRSIRVRPTSAILAFEHGTVDAAEAGRKLRVDHVLTGTVQQVDEAYRFNLQLVRVSDGVPIWGQRFDVSRRTVFGLEDQIVPQVVGALQLQISTAERARIDRRYTDSPEAYEQYLQGRALLANYSDSNLRQSMEHFQRALAADPQFVLAQAGLATAAGIFSIRFAYEQQAHDWGRRAEELAARALAQDPNLGEAHLAISSAAGTLYRNFDWPTVIREAEIALSLNPNLDLAHSALARAFYHIGLLDRSETESALAERISGGTNVEVSRVHLYNRLLSGHADEAKRMAETLLSRTDAPVVRQYLGLATFYLGDPARARETLAAVHRPDGLPDTRSQASLSSIVAASGAREEAERIIRAVLDFGYMDHHVAYSLGAAEAQLGRSVEAVKWLRQATQTGFPCYPWFDKDSLLDPVRADPQFRAFIADLRRAYDAARTRYASARTD